MYNNKCNRLKKPLAWNNLNIWQFTKKITKCKTGPPEQMKTTFWWLYKMACQLQVWYSTRKLRCRGKETDYIVKYLTMRYSVIKRCKTRFTILWYAMSKIGNLYEYDVFVSNVSRLSQFLIYGYSQANAPKYHSFLSMIYYILKRGHWYQQ